MSSYSEADSQCEAGDTICEVRVYEQEVIVVPVLLLLAFMVVLLGLCLLRFCPEKVTRLRAHTSAAPAHSRRTTDRQNLKGIDAPPGLNPLEDEVEVFPLTTQRPRVAPATQPVVAATPPTHGSFQLVTPLPLSFSVKPDGSVSLYRARMDNRAVILRTLKETADAAEHRSFLAFAHFLSELGPHPFLPALVGVVSLRTPLIAVVEELENRDLLGFLWRCRQDHTGDGTPCDMTEKRIFTMGGQVGSALEFLHSKSCIHGNVGARSVLVGRDLTAKLWGLGPAFRRREGAGSPGEVEDMELRKWHAPEVLAGRPANQISDVWSFGILLYEMVTLGDPPFPSVMACELLQYLQRGKTLKRPVNCSHTLYAVIKACCQWGTQDRVALAEAVRRLQAGERSASDGAVLRVPGPLDMEAYMREAGYGEAYNYAAL